MRAWILLGIVAIGAGCSVHSRPAPATWAVAIHGGAGVIERASMNRETEAAYRAALSGALEAAAKVLREGRPALDAVESAIRLMEDDPLFNAGRGAVFTAAGRNELDASIMEGATLNAGAAASVTRARHPITLARTVMQKSPHVMLVGDGADSFAEQQGLEIVDPSFFFTERRWQELEKTLKERGDPIPARPAGAPKPQGAIIPEIPSEHEFGTVGVVALDSLGNLAAGTSTGGTSGKRWGRVGDSPIIGAGTYASNQSCAVSGTGVGEFFIRLTVAREICALVQYKNFGIQQAADEVIQKRLTALNGSGGVIVASPKGEIAWSFNTPGMYRASMAADRPARISIFKDEP
ncbi:MAG: isoaspartyl peptidase/L-asparaginase [Acidobacteria bacterium]|nr:MAG: isoaspartyl peptidase/L-asparaginase [Acidobacteriota bacterium]